MLVLYLKYSRTYPAMKGDLSRSTGCQKIQWAFLLTHFTVHLDVGGFLFSGIQLEGSIMCTAWEQSLIPRKHLLL